MILSVYLHIRVGNAVGKRYISRPHLFAGSRKGSLCDIELCNDGCVVLRIGLIGDCGVMENQ